MRMIIVALATALSLCAIAESKPKNPVRGWYLGLDAGSSQLEDLGVYDFVLSGRQR